MAFSTSQKTAKNKRRTSLKEKISRASYTEIPKKHVLEALDLMRSPHERKPVQARKKERCETSCLAKIPLSANYQLFKAQRKAILHHDWDTAINYLYFMLDRLEFSCFSVRQFLLILFNHPSVPPDAITSFLSDSLNLFSKREQQSFLAHMFNLRSDTSEELEQLLDSDEFEYE